MIDSNLQTRPRLCVFGAQAAEAGWLARVRAEATNCDLALFGASADSGDAFARIEGDDAAAVLHAAAEAWPGDEVILLRANTTLPPYWYSRLMRALAADDTLVASPLDNTDPARSPLITGLRCAADAAVVDALCHAYGRGRSIDTSSFSPLLSAWSGAGLQRIVAANVRTLALPQTLAPLRGVVLDHLYVADPATALRGPAPVPPGGDAMPPSPLGELRERVSAALTAEATPGERNTPRAYFGLDDKPVVLHVLHGWGGGAERFVRDLASADAERHHLVLVARGNFPRRCYGESLELVDGAFSTPALRSLTLPNPIRSTTTGDTAYKAFLDEALRDYHVDALMISSLIGHSLDALRSGLPTVLVTHDYYPLWPILHRDFGDAQLAFDDAQLAADLARAGTDFEFAEREPEYWRRLRAAYVSAALAAKPHIVAPSRSALQNLLRLEPRLKALVASVIPHGLAPWPPGAPVPTPAPPARPSLRLVVPGRVRRGKGAELLRAALPALREHAELFLLGAGAEGEQFFGETGVHVVLNYRRADLPALLAQIRPDAALLLPTVAETFSYTLSELSSLGIPAIATRVGALAERIKDGVDGWLVAPAAESVAAGVERLAQNPAAIGAARASLVAAPPHDLAQMAADYAALLPLSSRRVITADATASTSDTILAQTRADLLGNAQRLNADLREQIARQQGEIAQRSDWAIGLEHDVRRARRVIEKNQAYIAEQDKTIDERTQWAQQSAARETETRNELSRFARVHKRLQIQFDERTRWATELDGELQNVRGEYTNLSHAHTQLQNDFDERTRWALQLNEKVQEMLGSTSWRITGPLRFAMRKLRGARTRIGFQLKRVRSAAARTRGSLARRGLFGTFRRIGEEFARKRGAPVPAPIIAVPPVPAKPDAPLETFAVPTSAQAKVSIVIPVYNKIEYTVACLRSLGEHAGATPFEVIVVDDGSSDATPAQLAQIDGIRAVRNERNLGFIGSCNAGAALAHGEFVLFLNNDTVVTRGWLDALVACFAEEPDAGLVGAKLVYPDGRLQEAGGIVFRDGSGWNYGRFDNPNDPRYEYRREADYCSGAAIMLPRALFERLGAFDTRYTPAYYEDTDLAFAVRAAGKKVFYEPRSVVIHFEGITSGTDTGSGVKQYQVVNREKFLDKWKDALTRQPAPIDSAKLAPAAANFRSPRRVLVVDAYTPTPDQDSGSLRMTNLMRLLREAGWHVSFLPDNWAHAEKYTEGLQALGVEALYHPFFADPAAWLRENGESLDAVILSRHYVASNYLDLVRLYAPRATVIFDTVDLHYLREQRSAELEGKPELARQAAATREAELELMRECDITLVVSPVEQAILAREVPQARVEVLSNVHEIYGLRRGYAERADLVFVGGFQHPPNIDAMQWFVREVFPRVVAQAPAVKLHIIGSKVVAEVLALASDSVVVHGYVEDIAPYMDGCRISVAPLRVGAGVKGKVNMAMSYGLPVVATATAVEGMHVDAGREVLVADKPADFADAVVRLYGDEALWNTLSANGLENVRSHFSFEAARAALKTILP
ncbi:MAG: glycosyltransferase [Rudaea sp.]|uniref:glycosyltransferase n=1 Tax=unclassified Rudaea TaxID=2627037 RepID=UPI0010F9344C|nr:MULTISPECIES: glycosyltransferase [unclassified Rudaea]MBN8886381.1 glycosyltransferase [Rudaea sp.]